MTTRALIQDLITANPVYANAVVTAYTVDEDGEKTAIKATLYASLTGSTAVTCWLGLPVSGHTICNGRRSQSHTNGASTMPQSCSGAATWPKTTAV